MIKILAYQKYGVKTQDVIDKFEFCCWLDLYNWLEGFGRGNLHKCPKHTEKMKDD